MTDLQTVEARLKLYRRNPKRELPRYAYALYQYRGNPDNLTALISILPELQRLAKNGELERRFHPGTQTAAAAFHIATILGWRAENVPWQEGYRLHAEALYACHIGLPHAAKEAIGGSVRPLLCLLAGSLKLSKYSGGPEAHGQQRAQAYHWLCEASRLSGKMVVEQDRRQVFLELSRQFFRFFSWKDITTAIRYWLAANTRWYRLREDMLVFGSA